MWYNKIIIIIGLTISDRKRKLGLANEINDINSINGISVENLGKGYEIFISAEHRFGTDAFLLADFSRPRQKDLVCDFCSGCGIVALLMHRNFRPAHIDAVEIQPEAHELLLKTKSRLSLDDLTPLLCDLKDYSAPKELDLITCNPPYKLNGTGEKSHTEAARIARHETLCTIDDVCAAAAKNLKYGGRLCLCNRPERFCDVMVSMRSHGIEPKRVRFVSKDVASAPWLALVEGRKGGKPFMKIEPHLYTQDENGGFSSELKRIYGQE